ncbi:MAG TPA: hypothetical protein VIM14_16150, partial [Polyangia bacterium]
RYLRMSLVKLTLIFLVAHVAAALFFLLDRAPGTAAALVGLPLDDAWIHLVYARSLAALHGFAYNPGQLETGSTSPLWAVLLVPATWVAQLLGTSVVVPAKVTGVLCAVGASVGAARLVRGLGFGLAAELASGLALAVDPALAFAQVSGMEIMLASALALWALGDLAADRLGKASLWAALAPLARPELVLLTLLILALVEWRMHVQRAPLRARLRVLLPTVALVGGWMLYCQLVSGYLLPSTYYAKFASRQDYFAHNLVLIFTQVLPSWPWYVRGTGFVLWAVGAVALFRRGPGARLTVFSPILFLLSVAGSQLLYQPWPFFWQRYLLPAQALLLPTLAVGAASAVTWALQGRQRAWAPAYGVGVAVLVLGSVFDLPVALRRSADLFAWNCQNIEELNVAMATWLRDHVPKGEPIAVTDAGAARYFGEHPIVDLVGLNDHRTLHHEPGREREVAGIRTIATFSSLLPTVRNNPAWQVIHRNTTAHLTICDCPQSELVAYQRRDSLPP